MSAFLCEAHHVAYLAQFFYKDNKGYDSRSAQDVATILARANLESLRARYGDDPDDPKYVDECVKLAGSALWNGFKPSQVIQSAQCLEYQSCEVDDWEETAAAKLLNKIVIGAARKLRTDADIWGAPKPCSTNAVLLSTLLA